MVFMFVTKSNIPSRLITVHTDLRVTQCEQCENTIQLPLNTQLPSFCTTLDVKRIFLRGGKVKKVRLFQSRHSKHKHRKNTVTSPRPSPTHQKTHSDIPPAPHPPTKSLLISVDTQ
eukprot:GEMP01056060.1.p2 GENE.GEMP01056060.1~~GEMP01056060.1.p2  ORF type:complete len:116 (+),score=1.56 GEMP01056060.1:516-863(+)